MRKIADEAVATTKTARRQQERRLRVIQGGRVDPVPVPLDPAAISPKLIEECGFISVRP